MDIKYLRQVIELATQNGMQAQLNLMLPSSDKIKEREAKRFLKANGFTGNALDLWVEKGMVASPEQEGRGKAKYYSKSEVLKQALAVTLNRALM